MSASVIVRIPDRLRAACQGVSELVPRRLRRPLGAARGRGDTIPLYSSICDETGAVRRHVNLFVNTLHIRDRRGLDTPLQAGDVITILPSVSGG
jgi:molybdopterin converting factor small subunit